MYCQVVGIRTAKDKFPFFPDIKESKEEKVKDELRVQETLLVRLSHRIDTD
jgi:hypothetical protein